MKEFKSRSLTALTTAMFLAAAASSPGSGNDTTRANAALKTNTARDHRVASISISFNITGDSLDVYRRLSDEEHQDVDEELWQKLFNAVNSGGKNRMKNYRTYNDAPDHHEGHQQKGLVRRWMLRKNILPRNPHDVEEEPRGMQYGIRNGVPYCEHTHGAEEDSPFFIHTDSEPRIGARVNVSVNWPLFEY